MRIAAAAAILMALTACTMKDQDAPPLTGPSEQGTSLQLIANPDVLTQDGGSQSAITVIARGPSGQPLAGLSIRVDVTLDGAVNSNMGTLSARNIVTDSSGRADVVYTAPPPISDDVREQTVGIQFIAVGTDAANAVARVVSIRLLPEGSVGGGVDIQPKIEVSSKTVAVGDEVLFDGSGSTSSTGIQSYKWDFDDGHKGSDRIEVHSFSSPRLYNVELTVVDPYGNQSEPAHVTITVGPLAPPTASFTFFPTTVTTGTEITFDASASSAASGHTIVSYEWDFGTGETNPSGPSSNSIQKHTFVTTGPHTVTLTVTDDTGQKSQPKAVPITVS